MPVVAPGNVNAVEPEMSGGLARLPPVKQTTPLVVAGIVVVDVMVVALVEFDPLQALVCPLAVQLAES